MQNDDIRVSLRELTDAANILKTEADNIESAANKSDMAINNLRNMRSNRVENVVIEWDNLLKNIRSEIENFKFIADEQVRTANAFADADGQRN